ncbi:ZIP family metal transporter [Streptantibioticus rubrisoli]|uniref:ZIP family metal transporter n=1 Tax=Streptantibioticus rubrisoli TaxID=1387313 RepID=A0ABT1PCL8_9ACTN|nr:ZIP family metal transporter [Streptantibioticus rubrisoli]MCQ4043101.1 ZIP family metal transporter [Streptantibioticus rubrisoli]
MAVMVAVGAFWMTLLGGAVAHRIGDRRHLVLGFAAGLMLGAVGFDLLPEALRAQPANVFGVPAALLLFVAGFLAIHTAERAVAVRRAHEGEYAAHTHRYRHDRAPPRALGIAAASALIAHSVMDGFAIGAAFQTGATVGAVVALAVIAHDFADGFNTYTVTWLYGNDRRRTFALLGCDAVAPVVGAATTLGVTLPRGVLGLYLGFFAGFLCYLATCDILPEAHSPHPSLSTLLCTLAGAGFMWLVIAMAS